MTIITITPQPENGALRLAINTVETITDVIRSDANGVAGVRTLPGVLPWTAARVEGRRNLIINPSAGGGTTAGWAVTEAAISATTFSITGRSEKYFRVTLTALTAGAFRQRVDLSTRVPITAGNTYTLSLWARTTGAPRDATAILYYFDAAGSTVAAYATPTVPGATWTNLTASGPAPVGAVTALVRIGVSDQADWAVNDFFDFGAVMLSDTAQYFDGSTPASSDAVYSWAGAPYASQSIQSIAAGDLVLTDYEAGSGTVIYTAGTATASTTWDIGAPWLFVPVMPNYSARLQSVLDYSASGDSLGTIHELLGRTDPVAVLRGMGTRAGNLSLWCGTFPAAVAVLEALKRGQVLMLRQPEHQGMDMYFTATGYNIKPLTVDGAGTVWAVDVGYRQIARPLAPLAGSLGWTFAALASRYPTFAALPGAYATFQTLQLDEVKP